MTRADSMSAGTPEREAVITVQMGNEVAQILKLI